MTCQELAAAIERLQPGASPRDVARLCLLLANTVDDLDTLADDDRLTEAWQQAGWRLQWASDQHAAMTEELERISRDATPDDISAGNVEPTAESKSAIDDQRVWMLVRTIKVQSQVLQLYLGHQYA